MHGFTSLKLRSFQPFSIYLYTVVDEGIEWAKSKARVGNRRIRLSPHGLANMMRIYACDCLEQANGSRFSYERVTLLNDGIELQYLEHFIKVTKVPKMVEAAHAFLPLGATMTRRMWGAENGELFELHEIIDVEMIRRIHIMWDVDEHLSLNTFLFFLPNIGELPIPLPHPGDTIPTDEPMGEQRPSDIPELADDDEHQDLDEIGETGGE